MDSFEFNKIAAAVLAALLLMIGTPTLLEAMRAGDYGGKDGVKVGYALPEPSAAADAGAAPVEEKGFEYKSVASLFATASADAGKAVFKKCSACHTVNEGGRNGTGPNLWNVVGRGLGQTEGYNYSKALVEKGGIWDYKALVEFVHKPKGWLPGTKMAFAGLSSEKDLANLMVYLQSLSSAPKPLPAAE
jgi:cytochrome c